MANIPIRDIALEGTPSGGAYIVFDDGQMKKGTVASMADGVRPVASEGEAQAGEDNKKTMTPLRVKDSIASEVGNSIATQAAVLKAQKDIDSHAANLNNPHQVTAAQIGLGRVDNTSDIDKPISDDVQRALALKAPVNSPVLTGTPRAPTPPLSDASTSLATTAYVRTALATLSPGGQSAGRTPVLGQCQLVLYRNDLLLKPIGGNLLTVNGEACVIPAEGVSLSSRNAVHSTTYFIYATAVGGVVNALEMSETGHETDISTSGNLGNEIKSGEPARTLVGMASCTRYTGWTDMPNNRLVRSWHNRTRVNFMSIESDKGILLQKFPTEIYYSAHASFLAWADEGVDCTAAGIVYGSRSGNVFLANTLDGAQVGPFTKTSIATSTASLSVRCTVDNLTESQVHYMSINGWDADDSNGIRIDRAFVAGTVG